LHDARIVPRTARRDYRLADAGTPGIKIVVRSVPAARLNVSASNPAPVAIA